MNIINLLAAIASAVAGVYLFYISIHTSKGLKTGFQWMAIGISIGLVIHSLSEFLESIQIINVELLLKVMPPLVLIGSLMILVGSVILYKTIHSVGQPQKK